MIVNLMFPLNYTNKYYRYHPGTTVCSTGLMECRKQSMICYFPLRLSRKRLIGRKTCLFLVRRKNPSLLLRISSDVKKACGSCRFIIETTSFMSFLLIMVKSIFSFPLFPSMSTVETPKSRERRCSTSAEERSSSR